MSGVTVRVGLDRWSRDFDPALPPTARAAPGDRLVVAAHWSVAWCGAWVGMGYGVTLTPHGASSCAA